MPLTLPKEVWKKHCMGINKTEWETEKNVKWEVEKVDQMVIPVKHSSL